MRDKEWYEKVARAMLNIYVCEMYAEQAFENNLEYNLEDNNNNPDSPVFWFILFSAEEYRDELEALTGCRDIDEARNKVRGNQHKEHEHEDK